MKTPSSELFDLIQSMNKNEKMYFKTYIQRKSKNSNSKILFNTICELDVYDEASVKLSLIKKPILIKNLKKIKQDTIASILNSLTEYHSTNTIEKTVTDLIIQTKILSSKKLFSLVDKNIIKLNLLISEHELLEYDVLVSKLKSEISHKSDSLSKIQEYLDNIQTEKNNLVKIQTGIEFRELRFKAYLIPLKYGFSDNADKSKALKSILASNLLSTSTKLLTFETADSYYYLHYMLALSLCKYDKVVQKRQEEWIMFTENELNNPNRLNIRTEKYLESISAYLSISGYFKTNDKSEDYFKKAMHFYSELPAKIKNATVSVAAFKVMANFLHSQIISVNAGTAKNAWESFTTSNPFIFRFINTEMKRIAYMNMGQIYFMLEDYKQALAYTNQVITQKNDYRVDIQIIARIYKLMIQLELKNYIILKYLSETTQRWLTKNNIENNACSLILIFFLKAATTAPLNKDNFQNLKTAIISSTNNKYSIDFDYVINWLDSKIERKKFIDILKEKNIHLSM